MGREYMLRVKMNAEEKRRVEVLAAQHGLNMSNYVRMILRNEPVLANGRGRRRKRVA
jgi:antitoxin component of RelBE/YafQ-DinJ toxin-antitoxin module